MHVRFMFYSLVLFFIRNYYEVGTLPNNILVFRAAPQMSDLTLVIRYRYTPCPLP